MNSNRFVDHILFHPGLVARYRDLLRLECRDPTTRGADPFFCDTVPLYSRNAHLSFLDDLGIVDKEAAVLAMAFWYWLEVETTLVGRGYWLPYVNEVSFMDWDPADGDLPYPDLFFCANVAMLQPCRMWEPCSKRSERLLAALGRLGLQHYATVYEQPVDRDSDCTVIDFRLGFSPYKVFRWDSLRE